MTREEAIQEHIDEIMDTFDAEKCMRVMTLLNWSWPDGIPDVYHIRKELRKALKESIRHSQYSSGGFDIRFHEGIDEISGNPYVMFTGGFYIEQLLHDGVEYKKDNA